MKVIVYKNKDLKIGVKITITVNRLWLIISDLLFRIFSELLNNKLRFFSKACTRELMQ